MTKPNFSKIIALLDRSGSMGKVAADTIGGFNTFVEEQKKVPGEATLTLIQFNDSCETIYADVPLAHVAPLTAETYKPSGWTALNDALGKTITETGNSLAAKSEAERPSRVVVLIMTDGEENKSTTFVGPHGLTKLSSMVNHQKEKYTWEFVFIGANINAFSAANNYGIDRGHAINYSQERFGQKNAFKSLSRGLAASRITSAAGAAPLPNFFDHEKNKTMVMHDTLDTLDITETIKKYTESVVPTTLNKDKSDKPTT
jgi:hypothetical protein